MNGGRKDLIFSSQELRRFQVAPTGNIVVPLIQAMNASFDRVAIIVEEEDYDIQLFAYDSTKLLRSHLEAAIADEEHSARLTGAVISGGGYELPLSEGCSL